jgi:hypothetical protein
MSYSFRATAAPINDVRTQVRADAAFQERAPDAVRELLGSMLDTYQSNNVKTVNVYVHGHCPTGMEPGTAHIEVVVIE